MIQRSYRLVLAIIATQFACVAAFWSTSTPLHGLAVVGAILGAAGLLLFPQVGVLLICSVIIGQWPWNLFRYLGAATVSTAAISLILHKKSLCPRSFVLGLSVLMLLVGLISAIGPMTRVEIFSRLLALAGNVSIVWLFVAIMSNRRAMLMAVRLTVLSGILTAIIGLVQYRTHFVWISSTTYNALEVNKEAFRNKTAFDLQQWRGEFRVDSITGTPDYLPLYMQSLTPFVAFWVVRQKALSLKILGLGVLGLFGIAHVLSYTRGALLTTAILMFLLAWSIDRKRLFFYGPVVTLIVALAMLSWGPWRDRLATVIDLSSNETPDHVNTGAWRLRTIPVALTMIAERPFFGVGLGQQRWNWPESTIGDLIPDPKYAVPPPMHNDFLLVAVELGLGGLAVLLILLAYSLRLLHKLSVRFALAGDAEMADLSRGTMLGIAGMALAMPMYPMVENFRFFWLYLGFVAALNRIYEESNEVAPAVTANSRETP